MEKSRKKIAKKQEHCINKVLRNCYWLAKHHLASSLLADLNELCLLQGVDDFKQLVMDKEGESDSTTTSDGTKFSCQLG